MRRTIRTVVVILAIVSATGLGPAGATPDDERLRPRVLVGSPWTKDDSVGEAFRSEGDVSRIVIENSRQNVRFTFRMVATPIWDTLATNRRTFMQFEIDWQGTSTAYNRRVTVSRSDGEWRTVVFNGTGGAVCVRQSGGVQVLPNNGFRFSIPVVMCLGGAKVIRVATDFLDDQDTTAGENVKIDRTPNSGGYGPFIRLPA